MNFYHKNSLKLFHNYKRYNFKNKLMLESDFYFSMNLADIFYLALVIKNKISEEKKVRGVL